MATHEPVVRAPRSPQRVPEIGERLAMPAEHLGQDQAAAHQAARADRAPTASTTERSSSRSPLRVCPPNARELPERGPDVREPVRIATLLGHSPG